MAHPYNSKLIVSAVKNGVRGCVILVKILKIYSIGSQSFKMG